MSIKLTEEQLRQLARFELRCTDVDPECECDYEVEEKYQVTIADIKAAYEAFSKMDMPDDELHNMVSEEWMLADYDMVYELYERANEDIELPEGIPNATDIAWAEITNINYGQLGEDWVTNAYAEILLAERNIGVPFDQRTYSPEYRWSIIFYYQYNKLDDIPEEVVPMWRGFVEEFCEYGDEIALRAKAYSCYGGNAAYECDWETSRDCLLRLMEITEDPFIANTLGYIYYYGRCNGGEPEYEQAFKYFTIGAAGGVYESRYKLSDMFRHGHYVNKNMTIARNIVWELYDQNYVYMLQEHFDSKFADVALRMGKFAMLDEDYAPAYHFLLQAEYAIKQRESLGYYGDAKVAKGIAEELAKAKAKSGIITSDTIKIDPDFIAAHINPYLDDGYLCELKYETLKIGENSSNCENGSTGVTGVTGDPGEMSLEFRLLPKHEVLEPPKIWVTSTKAGFSGHVESLAVKLNTEQGGFCVSDQAAGRADDQAADRSDKQAAGRLVFNHIANGELKFYDDVVGEISGEVEWSVK